MTAAGQGGYKDRERTLIGHCITTITTVHITMKAIIVKPMIQRGVGSTNPRIQGPGVRLIAPPLGHFLNEALAFNSCLKMTYHSDNILRFSAERFDCRNSSALALLVHVGLAARDMSEAGQR